MKSICFCVIIMVMSMSSALAMPSGAIDIEAFNDKALNGDTEGVISIADYFLEKAQVDGDYTEAFQWCTFAAEKGNVIAQYNLAVLYRKSFDIKRQNFKEAFKWAGLAAEAGEKNAQYLLGIMYYCGEGVKADKVKAFQWFYSAAAQELGQAQLNAGFMLAEGEGVQRDDVLAYLLLHKALHNKQNDPAEIYERAQEKLTALENRMSAEDKNRVLAIIAAQNATSE